MLAQKSAPRVQARNANQKYIFPSLANTQAGIIATSEGNGIKLDSIVIIKKTPTYPNWSTLSTIKFASSANILKKLKNKFVWLYEKKYMRKILKKY